jgi:hypothetical protein
MKHKTDPLKRGRSSTGQMPMKYFRIADEDWQQIESAASASDETTSEYIRRVLLKDSARILKKKDA